MDRVPPERRFPRGVYDRGDEPDPRFSLANERTFLAWVRTSLAFGAGALALQAVTLPLSRAFTAGAAGVMAALAVVCAVQAWRGWMRTERSLRLRRPLPAPSVGLAVVVGVVVTTVGLACAMVGHLA